MTSGAAGALWHPSPNFGERRGQAAPELVVLHYTAMEGPEAALARLCGAGFDVSAHYLIAADGALFHLVAEDRRAWHAGRGEWKGRVDINSRSIGIELDNPGDAPYSEPQMSVLELLLGDILTRWNIAPEGVIAHSDFTLGRKTDPGPKFDWLRLARQGLSVWPDSACGCDADPGRFADAAVRFGYPRLDPNRSPNELRLLLKAFRLRFAPWRHGVLTGSDTAAAECLASRFGTAGLDL